MRVLHISTDPSNVGGIASVVSNFTHAGLIDGMTVGHLSVHSLGGVWTRVRAMVVGMLRFCGILARHPSLAIVHLHVAARGSFYRKSAFLLVAKALGKRTVFHLHAGMFARFVEVESGPTRRAFIRFVLRRADAVVVLSESWRLWMESFSGRQDILVIPNFVFAPMRSAAESGEEGYAIYLGHFTQAKGIPELVRAWQESHLLTGRSLRLYGNDPGSMKELLDSGQHSIQVFGWVTGSAKDSALLGARCLVLPSHAEGSPMCVIEAMAAGKPVIATCVGGIPELVEDGVSGFTVEPGDVDGLRERLESVFADDDLCREMGRRGRAVYERSYSPEVVVGQWRDLYRKYDVDCGDSSMEARA